MTEYVIADVLKNIEIKGCARCGNNHIMDFYKFDRPVVITDNDILYTHFGICSTNSQPVLLLAKVTPNYVMIGDGD